MFQVDGNMFSVSPSSKVQVGGQDYSGPLKWETTDDVGNAVEVPAGGCYENAAAIFETAQDGGSMKVSRKLANVAFPIQASYPGEAHGCSRVASLITVIFVAPVVWVNSLCVEPVVQ